MTPSTRSLGPVVPVLFALIAPGSAQVAGDDSMQARDIPACAEGLDARIEYFSPAIDADPVGAGLPWQPNPRCSDEGELEMTEMRFRGLVSDRTDWLAERRAAVDALIGFPVIHVRTTHFELAYDLDEIKVGRKKLKPVDGAALYAVRLEEHHDWIAATLGIDPESMERKNRTEVFIFKAIAPAATITTTVLGNTIGAGFKSNLVGSERSYFVLWNDPKFIESDEEFHQILVHGLAHNLYHDVKTYSTWLYDAHGWLYAGLAHHDEIRRFGPPITTCDPDDQLDFKHWLTPYWEANIRKAIKQRRDYDPAAVLDLDVDSMNAKHRQFAWSYVDFLMWYDAPKLADLLLKTKGEGMSSAEALQEVYGFDGPTFWSEWKRFVVDHYSTRPRKGPTPARKPRKP